MQIISVSAKIFENFRLLLLLLDYHRVRDTIPEISGIDGKIKVFSGKKRRIILNLNMSV